MSTQFVKNISISSNSVYSELIQFSISTDFVYTQLNVKTVPFQTIQFSIRMQFKCKYSLIVKNISISSY